MSEVNAGGALVKGGDAALSRADETSAGLQNGCIHCTPREDLPKKVARSTRPR